ncbi:unnamed protein product [Ilex paraguariensis]|uniref:Histidine kinase/HSP90-like ATPase domain-containing protein n=1 Tax=Ilex paraguariensis TaxID=185542 RepID=A0ABC8R4B9_9AQUA
MVVKESDGVNEDEHSKVHLFTSYLHTMRNVSIRFITFWCRIVCPGEGLPPELVQDMFHSSRWVSQEGLGLSMCRKILKLMKGEVQYIRESERCYFLIIIELPMPQRGEKNES